MKKIIGGLVGGLLLVAQGALHADDGEWQYWQDLGMTGVYSPQLSFKFNSQAKWTDDAQDFEEYNAEFGATRVITDWLSWNLFYRQQYAQSKNVWREENRIHTAGTIKWKWAGLSFSDRNRFEFRFRDGKDDTMRYRNKLTVKGPQSFTSLQWTPYVSDEIFRDTDGGEPIHRNRLYVGLKGKPLDKVKADLYLLWQQDYKEEETVDTYVVGTKVSLNF